MKIVTFLINFFRIPRCYLHVEDNGYFEFQESRSDALFRGLTKNAIDKDNRIVAVGDEEHINNFLFNPSFKKYQYEVVGWFDCEKKFFVNQDHAEAALKYCCMLTAKQKVSLRPDVIIHITGKDSYSSDEIKEVRDICGWTREVFIWTGPSITQYALKTGKIVGGYWVGQKPKWVKSA